MDYKLSENLQPDNTPQAIVSSSKYSAGKNAWKWILGALILSQLVWVSLLTPFAFHIEKKDLQMEQAQDIADWQAYRNDEYGFEFKYPKEVLVRENGNVVEVSDQRFGYPFDWSIELYKNQDKKDLEVWINSEFNSFTQQSDEDCKIVPFDKYGVTVSIKGAYTVLVDAPSMDASCGHAGYYTISPDKMTVIEFGVVQASPELYKDILSTFKFIK